MSSQSISPWTKRAHCGCSPRMPRDKQIKQQLLASAEHRDLRSWQPLTFLDILRHSQIVLASFKVPRSLERHETCVPGWGLYSFDSDLCFVSDTKRSKAFRTTDKQRATTKTRALFVVYVHMWYFTLQQLQAWEIVATGFFAEAQGNSIAEARYRMKQNEIE